jgi:hypothetical protein
MKPAAIAARVAALARAETPARGRGVSIRRGFRRGIVRIYGSFRVEWRSVMRSGRTTVFAVVLAGTSAAPAFSAKHCPPVPVTLPGRFTLVGDFVGRGVQLPADLAGLVDRVALVRCDSHPDVVARRAPNLPLLTAAPLVGACENAITYCISNSRLNQQQRRCGEEQKVFSLHSPGLSEAFLTKWNPWGRHCVGIGASRGQR